MSDVNWEKVETILDQALELPEDKRADFIENECGNNKQLKGEVTQLLESIFDSEGWLENPKSYKKDFYEEISDDVELLSTDRSLVGKKVGSYTIQEKIGEGGMGAVYMAERSDDEFDHRVAIKIIRHGKVTDENIRRFRREQDILASLNHPGIAKLFDGGITEDGFPYIIMEYVDGMPLTEYCWKYNCSVDEKISLFKNVLEAVRHAHESLVIHRDLKPGNILVDQDGNVKILDFGISKLLEEEEEALTQTGARLLTPRYAAPEQIRQQNITTATDLYALGIVFYELLAGTDPFELSELSRFDVEQTILEKDPPRPSSKVTSQNLLKQLQGDLDAIALKAIRKEPEKRYHVTNELLQDLDDYQKGLPVSAREDSRTYRTQKFLSRHKQGIAVVAGILFLIIFFAGFYTWRITEERNQAQLQAEKAEEITSFLIKLFESNDPTFSQGDTLTARQILEIGNERINELNDQPALKSEILEALGEIYALLSYPQKADSLQEASLSIKKDLYSSSDPELASLYFSLGSTKHLLGEYDHSIKTLDTAITYQRNIHGEKSKEVGKSLKLLAESLREAGEIDSAYTTIMKAKSIFEALGDTASEEYLKTLMEYGSISVAKGEYREGESIWRSSLQLSKKLYDPPSPKIRNNLNGLANVYKELKKFTKAESLYTVSIPMTKDLYGRRHINTGVTLNNLAGLKYYTKQYHQADSLYTEAYAILKEILSDDHPYLVSVLYNQANLKKDLGDFRDAEDLYKQVLKLDQEQLGKNHPNVASDISALASLYKEEKKYRQAIDYFNKSLEIRRQVYENPHHAYIALNERSLAEIMTAIGNYKEAEKLYSSALSSFIQTYGEEHEIVKITAEEYADLFSVQNKSASVDSLISAAKGN